MNVKVAAIVVTYNRSSLLEECLYALLNQNNTKSLLDIIVINNNSTDNTEQLIMDKFKNDIIYYNTNENLGGAGGFNFGLKKAYESSKKYDFFWLMDDDTIPQNNTLYEMINFCETKKNIGFISPLTLWTNNDLCLMNKQVKLDNKFIDLTTENGSLIKKCTFVSCLVTRDAVSSVGLPIKEFFIWSDDSEYTSRISKKFDCYFLNSCKVIHKMNLNNSTNIAIDDVSRISRYFYFYRNRFYIAKRDGFKSIIRYHCMILKHLFKVLFISKNKWKRIRQIFKGYIKGIVFNPKVEYINN